MRTVRNPPVDAALRAGLVDVWVRVTNAGGAVGFAPPVTSADVEPLARAELARVGAGRADLVVAFEGERPLGFGFLQTKQPAVAGHLGTVARLQRDPALSGRGVGAAVLDELEAAAWARGLERVVLTVRGGTGRERFYMARGYRLDGVLPGRLRLPDGSAPEELHMSKTRPGVAHGGVVLRVRRLDPDLEVPSYAHPGDAGLDLRARHAVALTPGQRAAVATGLAVAVPEGHVGLVHPRSGLAARLGLGLVNAPGTIDAGYRGEIQVLVINLDPAQDIVLARGDRIAQLLLQRVETASVEEVAELPPSPRGEGGFGSTGR